MTIEFACNECGRAFRVADSKAGARAKCPDCGTAIVVPSPAATTESRSEPIATPETASAPANSPPANYDDDRPSPPVQLRRRQSADNELDMTPMVDVTFLLLIFFMVTAAFSLQKSIEIPPQNEDAAQSSTMDELEEDQDTVIVRVDADNVFWVSSPQMDQEQIAPSELELLSKLRAARAGKDGARGATKMLVLTAAEARHEYVVKALDAGSAVGMDEVKLAMSDDE